MADLLRRLEREGQVHPSPATGQTAAALERRGLVRYTGRWCTEVELTDAGRSALTS